MIKIIKKSELPTYVTTCPNCLTTYSFQEYDFAIEVAANTDDFTVRCPECYKMSAVKLSELVKLKTYC